MTANTSCQLRYPMVVSRFGGPSVVKHHIMLHSPGSEDTERNTERVCADRASFVTCSTASLMGGCTVPVARDICQASCGRCEWVEASNEVCISTRNHVTSACNPELKFVCRNSEFDSICSKHYFLFQAAAIPISITVRS